ncbi:SH3 domain-containing protein [Chitinophaga silvatica]|uniref:SH3 domain-containing protein n=1 Tax=Chitinophaga silvatica TaxID=2282649 RepID=A0A3E1Y803_9BACT|nr:SH3 domain-containing protein [Chitinophaga silvatica]RFS21199.1 SH3 domain-containing protein [Chitinophaga silvatica]
MKLFQLVLLLSSAGIISCQSNNVTKQPQKDTIQSKPQDGHSEFVDPIVKEIENIDNADLPILDSYLPPTKSTDTLFIVLNYKNGAPVKLEYTTFEDGGAAYGTSSFYFLKDGKIVHKYNYDSYDSYQVYMPGKALIWFTRNKDDKQYKITDIPADGMDAYLAAFMKNLNDLIQVFPQIKFNIPQMEHHGDLLLIVFAPLKIYESPDTTSKLLGTLETRDRVGFVGVNNKKVTIEEKTWIWYHVRSRTIEGWVIGHPDFIQELNDENGD